MDVLGYKISHRYINHNFIYKTACHAVFYMQLVPMGMSSLLDLCAILDVIVTNLRLIIGAAQPKSNSIGFVVETSDGVIHQGNVNFNSAVVNIPKEFQIINSNVENRQKGIHVYTLSKNEEIYVLIESFIETLNHGIFLAYSCGFEFIEESTSFEYCIVSIEDRLLHSEFLLVGCYNDTIIEIIPAQSVDLPINLQTQNISEPQVMTVNPGSSYHVIIHQMQTLLVLSAHDLSILDQR